jgi:endoglucanase
MNMFKKIAFPLVLTLMLSGCSLFNSASLNVSTNDIQIPKGGGSVSFTLQTDASSWKIDEPASWLSLSKTEGTEKEAEILVSVLTKCNLPRKDTLVIRAENADVVRVIISQDSSAFIYDQSTNRVYVNFTYLGGTAAMVVTSEAPSWNLSSEADWLSFTPSTGKDGTTTVSIKALANSTPSDRTANILLTAEGAPTCIVPVTQKGAYPDYNISPQPADQTGMSSSAVEIAAKIKVGINIGNTLEAVGGETAWGNPLISNTLLQSYKALGFNAVRLPCSWNQYANQTTAKISDTWLARVKQVVQYCVNNDLFVVLNIHWDGGWLENNCTVAKQTENLAKQRAFWQQIATTMRDFDEHLLFASANEPNAANATEMGVLLTYHQAFINAVRSTGGKNAYRVLVVQGPSTDISTTNSLMSTMPTDVVSGRMMAEVHYYTPWNFTGMSKDETWGNMFYYWGLGFHSTTDLAHNANWGEESAVDDNFNMMKRKFVDKGIPVIVGEFGAMRRSGLSADAMTLHKASRAYFLKYVTKRANTCGLMPFYWDTGILDNTGSGIIDRTTGAVGDQQSLDALMQGAAGL